MKITKQRLKEIIKEEFALVAEVHSEKQRKYMCAMADEDADRPADLSKAEAEEMCTGPMKEARMRWDREISAAAQELDAPAGFVDLIHQALLSAAADYMDQAQMEMAEALGMLLAGAQTGELE